MYFLVRIDHHSLHSPNSFEIYRFLRHHKRLKKNGSPQIETRRKHLQSDKRRVEFVDLGAGSSYLKGSARTVSQLATVSSSSLSYNLLYQGLCLLTPRNTVVELGSCVGINTSYLAEVTVGSVYAFEGVPEIFAIAKETVRSYSNVTLIAGGIDSILPSFLKSVERIDFCLLDANHTYEATIRYARAVWPYLYGESILVIGDIHWSPGMTKAWKEISSFPGVTLSMDFFECGVVFFNDRLNAENLVLYFPS